MVNQGYVASSDPKRQNTADLEHYIAINYAGCLVTSEPFTTHVPAGRADYTLLYLTQGNMDILTDFGRKQMSSGQLIVYRPGQEYWYRYSGGEPFVCYWAHFTGYGAQEMLKECLIPIAQLGTAGLLEPVTVRFAELFRRFLARQSLWEVEASADLQCIFALLGRGMLGNTVEQGRTGKLALSLEYLHDHYEEPVSQQYLAKLEHLSVSRYRTLFKEVTGMPLHDYLIELRLRHACVLLGQTGLSIRQVAAAVGYADEHYFSRLFRKRFGVPPKSLRGKG